MQSGAMEYRRLGRTGLSVSAVGFGTCQLRRVTKAKAIDTLLRGFELGVNLVHTAPDYEGAEDLVATAVARTDRHVIVASQGYDVYYNSHGRVLQFERLFESTCRKLKTDRLDLFGIACVDDREAYRENVWGRGGMVEFLHRMKAKGRLGGTFCTTHGNPEYIGRLIDSGAFDAIMVAYNDLGFHLLSVNPPPGRHFEDIPRTGSEVFPLAAKHDVGVMVMKPFAGGLLCPSKAFPPGDVAASRAAPAVAGRDVLRSILSRPEVACVVPGTASVEEAEENARAGHAPLAVAPADRAALAQRVDALRASLCSRCGLCEPSCSQRMPIAMLFRAAYVALNPAESFETWDEAEYFRLQPRRESTCATCPDVSCACPAGIDIPKTLTTLNGRMVNLLDRGGVAPPPSVPVRRELAWFAARVVTRDLPSELRQDQSHPCRLFVENTGFRPWHPPGAAHRSIVRLAIEVDGARVGVVNLRETVIHGRRCHFVFDLLAPADCGTLRLCLRLVREHPWRAERAGLVLFNDVIPVRENA
jgi:predicted aldo/keto reductase-like oxidoreductase